MTVKDLLSSLGTLNVQVVIKDSEGTMLCKTFANSFASLEESLQTKNVEKWSITKTTLIVIRLKSEEDPPVEPVSVTSVELNTRELNLSVNESATLVATILPEDATNKEINWSVDDNTIATVEDGVVTALSEGTALITVITVDGSFTDECTVNVT